MSEFKVDELRLLTGVPYQIEGVCAVRPLKLREIAELGELKYHGYLGILCFNKNDILKDMPEEKKAEISAFDIVLSNYIRDIEFKRSIDGAVKLFTGEDIAIREDGSFQVGDLMAGNTLDRDSFEKFRKVLMAQNGIEDKKAEMPEAGNSLADEFMKQMEALKNKYKKHAEKKNNISMADMINAVAWKSGVGIDRASDMTVYQLHEAVKQLQIIDNYTNVMFGIYTGNVDANKMEGGIKNLNWIKDKEQ